MNYFALNSLPPSPVSLAKSVMQLSIQSIQLINNYMNYSESSSQIKGTHLLEKCSLLYRTGKLVILFVEPTTDHSVLFQFMSFAYVYFIIYGKWLIPASFK